MSEFLLLGMRGAVPGEVSPTGAARDLAALAAWLGWLRRWGLLRAFAAVPPGPPAVPGSPPAVPDHAAGGSDQAGSQPGPATPRACLVVRASGPAAAGRLAAGWERLGGYHVTVLPLVSAGARPRRGG